MTKKRIDQLIESLLLGAGALRAVRGMRINLRLSSVGGGLPTLSCSRSLALSSLFDYNSMTL